MKKNISYMQTCVINEVCKLHSMQKFAESVSTLLMKEVDIELTIYETNDDGFVLRKKKDGTVTDNEIIAVLKKTIKKMIDNCDDFDEIISDIYDFEYDKKLITEEYLDSIVIIRRGGRLIYVEFDI